MAQASSRSFKRSLRSIRGRSCRRSRSCPAPVQKKKHLQATATRKYFGDAKSRDYRRTSSLTRHVSDRARNQRATATITANFQSLVLRSLTSSTPLTFERHYSTVPLRNELIDQKKEVRLPLFKSPLSEKKKPKQEVKKDSLPPLFPIPQEVPIIPRQSPSLTSVEDPHSLFQSVWSELVEKYGETKLVFPKDIMWLAGAPGSGKGKMTPFILKSRGITTPPLEVSSILTSEEAKEAKKRGELVSDRVVLHCLLQALLREEYKYGVIVDGFPRSRVQAECLILFFNAMKKLWRHGDVEGKFRRPSFQITVLYVEQENSIKRQLSRAQAALRHNEIVKATGHGVLEPVRDTDLDPALAKVRYLQFKDGIYDSLKAVKHFFPFHFINAEGTVAEVEERILKELQYQSFKELDTKTLAQIAHIPLASEVTKNARHELIKRLDSYSTKNTELLASVVKMIQEEFLHIIQRQALTGKAIIRSENPVLSKHGAIDIMLDVLAERGYNVLLDVFKESVPKQLDLRTGEITCLTRRVYELHISFPKATIRV